MMKNKILKSLVLMGLLFSHMADADMHLAKKLSSTQFGGLVGNGGGVVVCRDPRQQITSIELLDFYEARTLRNFNIDIASFPGNWKQKAQEILTRIRSKSEMRFQLYTLWLNAFESEMKILENVEFSTVPDSGYIGVPPGCDFEQAAIQRPPIFKGDSRYYVNASLWSAMDDNSKAGLVLHEIIYREALGYTHTNSIRSRYLTGLYASDGFAKLSLQDYWDILGQAHFELADVSVIPELMGSVTTSFSPLRIWQVGAGEAWPTWIDLQNEWVVKIGTCVAVGCEAFSPNVMNVADSSTYDYLAPDFSQISIGDTKLYASAAMNSDTFPAEVPEPIQDDVNMNLRINLLPDKSLGLSLSSESEQYFSTMSPVRHAGGVRDLRLQRTADQTWSSDFIIASFLLEDHPPGSHMIFGDDTFCFRAIANYQNGIIQKVTPMSDLTKACKNETKFFNMQIANTFSNGYAKLTVSYPNQTEILFDPTARGRFIDSERNYNEWLSLENNFYSIICSYGENCLKVIHNQNMIALQLFAQGESAQITFANPAQGSSGYTSALANTSIDLFQSGAPQAFTAGKSFDATIQGKVVTIPSGAKVQMDNSFHIVSYH